MAIAREWFDGTGMDRWLVTELRPGAYRVSLRAWKGDERWDDAEWFAARGLDIFDFRVRSITMFTNEAGDFVGLQTTYEHPGAPDVVHTLPRRLVVDDGRPFEVAQTIDFADGERIAQLDQSISFGTSRRWPCSKVRSSEGNEVTIGKKANALVPTHRWTIDDEFVVVGFAGTTSKSLRSPVPFGHLQLYVTRPQVEPWSLAGHKSCPEGFKTAVQQLLLSHKRASKESKTAQSSGHPSVGALPMDVLLLVVERIHGLETTWTRPEKCPVSYSYTKR